MPGHVLVLAEKPSAAAKFAAALGGRAGTYAGARYRIYALAGHTLRYAEPHEMVGPALAERYRSWNPDNLPWDPDDLSWERVPRDDGKRGLLEGLARELAHASEACIATDVDPTGEGELLAWEALDHVGWEGRTTRMYFTDEEPATVRRAFEERRPLEGGSAADGDCAMAEARSRFDFLSMQLTRCATAVARSRGHRSVVRQGRLKTVMVAMVGDQLAARESYVRKPYYEARFEDGRGHSFAVEGAERHDRAEDVDLSGLRESGVVVDEVRRMRKAPPKLPDLATLSSELAERGHGPREVLETYQRMYEAGVLSYPRTEDRTVTPEQFEALLPHTDAIARSVGVDPATLTHRKARDTHVRVGGAHGANRPGPEVPESADDLAAYGACAPELYELVARSWLALMAPDLEYDRHEAHVADYPEYRATADVPAALGWGEVLGRDVEGREFGETATPVVHEGANKRPQRPTAKWLQRQLERYDVGTGATRTSVLAEAEDGGDAALLREARGVLSLTECGRTSHTLTRGTKMASPEVTEGLLSKMREVRDGSAAICDVTALVAPLVTSDLAAMRANARDLPDAEAETLGPCPRCGRPVVRRPSGSVQCASNTYEREGDGWRLASGCGWGMGRATVHGKPLTDAQVSRLLGGGSVTLRLKGKSGRPYGVRVRASKDARYGTDVEFTDERRGARRA